MTVAIFLGNGRFLAMIKILNLIVFVGLSAFAVSEKEIKDIFYSDVVPMLTEKSERKFFVGKGDLKINYYHYKTENPSTVLVVAPGRGESALKYAEMVYDLKDAGVDIFLIDHRGQGASDRMVADRLMAYVDDFSDYVTDFTHFVQTIVKPGSYKHSVLFAHSMGGAISGGFLKSHPKAFSKIVLSAPMFELDTKPFNEGLALYIAKHLVKYGRGMKYAPTQEPYDYYMPFSKNTTTNSPERFELSMDHMVKNPLLPVGGSSTQWVLTSLQFTREIRKVPNLFLVPTVIVQAGDDEWVKENGQKEVCDLSPNFCTLQPIPEAKHEIYLEKDKYRDPLMTTLKSALEIP